MCGSTSCCRGWPLCWKGQCTHLTAAQPSDLRFSKPLVLSCRASAACHEGLHPSHPCNADSLLCVWQHELLQRLAPLLEEAMHPFDCCASSGRDRRSSPESSKPLPLSRRASAASHEDLHHLINQVCLPCIPSAPHAFCSLSLRQCSDAGRSLPGSNCVRLREMSILEFCTTA